MAYRGSQHNGAFEVALVVALVACIGLAGVLVFKYVTEPHTPLPPAVSMDPVIRAVVAGQQEQARIVTDLAHRQDTVTHITERFTREVHDAPPAEAGSSARLRALHDGVSAYLQTCHCRLDGVSDPGDSDSGDVPPASADGRPSSP